MTSRDDDRVIRRPAEPGDLADLGDQHRAQYRPDPGQRLHRGEPGCLASRPLVSLVNNSISKSNASRSRRAEPTRARAAVDIAARSSSWLSPIPNRSLIGTVTL